MKSSKIWQRVILTGAVVIFTGLIGTSTDTSAATLTSASLSDRNSYYHCSDYDRYDNCYHNSDYHNGDNYRHHGRHGCW